MSEQYFEWVSKINKTSGFYYIRVPKVYGERYHKLTCRVRIEVLEEKLYCLKE